MTETCMLAVLHFIGTVGRKRFGHITVKLHRVMACRLGRHRAQIAWTGALSPAVVKMLPGASPGLIGSSAQQDW